MKKENKELNFDKGVYKVGKVSAKGVPFAKLYFSKNIPLKYGIAVLAGLIFAVLSLFFVKNTGGFSFGFGGLMQGIDRLIVYFIYKSGVSADKARLAYSILFWGLILVVNTPLFFFSWKKIGKRFTLLTLVFLVSNSVFGLLLDLIPNIDNIFLFGDTRLYVVNNLPIGYTSWIVQLRDMGINILPFSVPESLRIITISDVTYTIYDPANYAKPFFLLFSQLVYAFAGGVVFAMLYVVGGSTAGTDFISVYLSAKKGMNVSTAFFFINLGCVILASVLGCYIPAALEIKECSGYQFFFSANLINTIISLLIFTLFFRKFYPRNKKYRVEIISNKVEKIKKQLYNQHYVHATSLTDFTGGYKGKKIPAVMTICSTLELPLLLDIINIVDSEAIVDVTDVKYFQGSFASRLMGSE